jgi:hypothetical protein
MPVRTSRLKVIITFHCRLHCDSWQANVNAPIKQQPRGHCIHRCYTCKLKRPLPASHCHHRGRQPATNTNTPAAAQPSSNPTPLPCQIPAFATATALPLATARRGRGGGAYSALAGRYSSSQAHHLLWAHPVTPTLMCNAAQTTKTHITPA